jgi:hypothetical protein
MSSPRIGHVAALMFQTLGVLRPGVLVAGGSDGFSILSGAEIYNPLTNSWSAAPAMLSPHTGATATVLPDATTVPIAGGTGADGTSS